jgi:hypothetical protein
MKKILFALVMLSLLVSVTHAGLAPSILPSSSHYQGQQSRSFDLGSEGILDVHLEFAVYAGDEAVTMRDMTGYGGDPENATFVYAYQIFCDASSTAELTYFALTGVNPDAIAFPSTDAGQAGSMIAPNDSVFDSEGVAPSSDGYFNDSKTKSIWEFGDTAIVDGEQSWFLFLYSNKDWIAGEIEVQQANDDIPIPGDGGNSIPEPATLILLGLGTFSLFKTRKN